MSAQEIASDGVQQLTRWVPDFPSEGVHFADLTPVLADASTFDSIMECMAEWAAEADLIAGLDARGFLIAAGVAVKIGSGVLALRKRGKLPAPVYSVEYDLEYGSAALEIPAEGMDIRGKKVFIVDDVLATGGTSCAAAEVIGEAGGEVIGFSCILELSELEGRQRLHNLPIYSIACA